MILQELHSHTVFCDGRNTPEEMVLAAIAKGLTRIGLCVHAYTWFDPIWCGRLEEAGDFQREVARLKKQYRDRIEVLCGVEQEFYSESPTEGFDYVIGSAHYVKQGSKFYPVDESPEKLIAAKDAFSGDFYALAECYFATVAEVVARTNADFIGHFDLISKFNEGGCFFDESHPRYVAAYTAALDKLLLTGKPFEVNTGAIARGCRTEPYPSRPMLQYLASHGGRVFLTSDSHQASTICYEFSEWNAVLDAIGLPQIDPVGGFLCYETPSSNQI